MHKYKNGNKSVKDECKSGRKRSLVTDKNIMSSLSLSKMPEFPLTEIAHIAGILKGQIKELLESKANMCQTDTTFANM
jgi:hypothetical protein